jgi:8-oxo-dGTP pyrophosphatase MutT (NUDIX family)
VGHYRRTLEPGEGYLETIRREALEEAGAHLISFRLFGAWKCHALGGPYRPHLPHPKFYRVVGEVELRSAPANPPSTETITAVEAVSLETAVARLAASGQQHHRALAELYQLASQLPR